MRKYHKKVTKVHKVPISISRIKTLNILYEEKSNMQEWIVVD